MKSILGRSALLGVDFGMSLRVYGTPRHTDQFEFEFAAFCIEMGFYGVFEAGFPRGPQSAGVHPGEASPDLA
jgi:hypothetical protein